MGNRTVNDMGEESEDRLLTDEEYFAAFEEPVTEGRSPCWNIAIAQDAKTARFFQAQVDVAEADAERSMAAYKDLYAATNHTWTMHRGRFKAIELIEVPNGSS